MKRSVIKLENVWKIYKMGHVNVPALQGLEIEIKEGEFVSVIGPSGSGKSTALNMIGALDVPTKGKIFLDGRNISQLTDDQLARLRGRKIGFIFQTFNLIPSLNALENVELPMLFQNVEESKRKAKAKRLLTEVGLGDRTDHKPNQMSGGERQRVAIARALANDPEVILADEPTGNLDSKSGDKVMEILTNLHKNKKRTLIIVTHDLEVAHMSERIIKLKDGRVIR